MTGQYLVAYGRLLADLQVILCDRCSGKRLDSPGFRRTTSCKERPLKDKFKSHSLDGFEHRSGQSNTGT